MAITTKEQAFQVLETQKNGIPFEAIDFLYNSPTDEDILNKIRSTLEQIYDNIDQLEEGFYSELWYAIAAENHLDLSLLDAIIGMLTKEEYGDEYINEQAGFLIGLMAKKHGNAVVDKVLEVIQQILEEGNILVPYEYLFEVVYHADEVRHKAIILQILSHTDSEDVPMFAAYLCQARLLIFLPAINEFIKIQEERAKEDEYILFLISPLLEALEDWEKGKEKQPPYIEIRKHWKLYYKEYEDDFEESDSFGLKQLSESVYESDDSYYLYSEQTPKVNNTPKIGRNDPCPCGSGKKYKKCCLKNK